MAVTASVQDDWKSYQWEIVITLLELVFVVIDVTLFSEDLEQCRSGGVGGFYKVLMEWSEDLKWPPGKVWLSVWFDLP